MAIMGSGLLLAALVSGCAQTVQSGPSALQQVEGEKPGTPSASGFLGSAYSSLQPGKEGQALLVYINPSAQWSKYSKIMLEPVEFWDSGNSSVSPSDQHMLTAYFYNVLKENLQKNFTLVDQGGPGVITLQFALINASAATPGLRSVTVIVPQMRVLNAVQSLGTGSYAFVGSAEAAMKATDSVTGELLAAAIDQRKGGLSITAAAQWKWGDAENAMKFWAEKANERLTQLKTTGTIATN